MDLEWPEPPELGTTVPTRVREIYGEAVAVKPQSANAFANQIRRALEAVCNEHNAEGDNLHNMLGNLSARDIIPDRLSEMTGLLRQLGNAGSHDAEFDIDERFVEPIDDFFQTVVRYVYVLPSRIEEVQQEYEQAIQQTEEGTENAQ